MSGRAFGALVGAVAVIIGFFLLFLPVHVSVADKGDLSCGSASHEDYSDAIQSASDLSSEIIALGAGGGVTASQLYSANSEAQNDQSIAVQIASGCDSSIGARRAWVWSLIIAGGVVLLGAGAIRRQPVAPAPPAAPAP